jgi:hypothetical protein
LPEILCDKISLLNDLNFDYELFVSFYIDVSERLSMFEEDTFGKEMKTNLRSLPNYFKENRHNSIIEFWELDKEFNFILSSYIKMNGRF